MEYRVVMEYDFETESIGVYCLDLPGCFSTGETVEEALANIKDAIVRYLGPNALTEPISISY